MNRLLLLPLLLALSLNAFSQRGFLFVKKGIKKKKTYVEGGVIQLQLQNGAEIRGVITLLRNDTIFLNGKPIPKQQVSAVIIAENRKQGMKLSGKQILIITAGTAMTVAGLKISGQATMKEAITAGLVIGYGQLGIAWLRSRISLKRTKYRIGKKFQLSMLDLHLPRTRAF